MERRAWLRLAAASGAWCRSMSAAPNLAPARNAVDHLVLGASDLDRAVAWLEGKTGVRAVPGGSHPGVGTRNALVSLGGRRYLEILAPDPAQTAYNSHLDVRTLTQPRLIAWAAATADINGIARRARESGHQVFGPRDGSRARPDGSVLRWKTLGVMNPHGREGVDPIPFFIEWGHGSLHPSQDSPTGGEIEALEIDHPDAAGVRDLLRLYGIDAKVNQAGRARLVATLKTRRGKVELG